MTIPSFFNIEEEPCDDGYETMQDFFLQWALHCAQEEVSKANEYLQLYAKEIALKLLFGQMDDGKYRTDHINPDDYEILEVKTWRQWSRIDLSAEIKIKNKGGEKQQFALNIENKWYTRVSPGQLENARDIMEEHYEKTKPEMSVFKKVVYADYDKVTDQVIKSNSEKGYDTLTPEDLFQAKGERAKPTGNYLFDTYWIHPWPKRKS